MKLFRQICLQAPKKIHDCERVSYPRQLLALSSSLQVHRSFDATKSTQFHPIIVGEADHLAQPHCSISNGEMALATSPANRV
jgi:hypothetical protein